MAVLKHIALLSALKIGFLIFAVLGSLTGLLCSAVAFAGIPFGPHAQMPLHGALVLLPLILCPLFYGIFGAIICVFGALIYNLVSRWAGGLEVDLR